MTPTEQANSFFLQDFPALVAREAHRYRALHGTLAFSCCGAKYTVALGDVERPVIAGFLRTADVKLWFFRDGFARFLVGQIPDKRDLRLEGDGDVLARFGRLLLPATSSLGVRTAA